MSYIEIVLLSFALSVDACVVSFSYGLCFEKERVKNALTLGLCTGIFQALMPVIGYFAASLVKTYISPYSKIIIFTIFLFLGLKFIKDAFNEEKAKPVCISLACLLLIGIATSIDAFSAGISLLLAGNLILKPALLIGLVTFANAILGFHIGGKIKHIPSKFLEIFAGVVLIILGLKAII